MPTCCTFTFQNRPSFFPCSRQQQIVIQNFCSKSTGTRGYSITALLRTPLAKHPLPTPEITHRLSCIGTKSERSHPGGGAESNPLNTKISLQHEQPKFRMHMCTEYTWNTLPYPLPYSLSYPTIPYPRCADAKHRTRAHSTMGSRGAAKQDSASAAAPLPLRTLHMMQVRLSPNFFKNPILAAGVVPPNPAPNNLCPCTTQHLGRSRRHRHGHARLSVHLKRRMTFEQLSKAVNLAVTHRTREWGIVQRFAIPWMCSSARRNSDMRGLTWRSMCIQEQRVAGDENPWVSWGHAEPC